MLIWGEDTHLSLLIDMTRIDIVLSCMLLH